MRGYFGIGVEGISKPMNLGAVTRTAHAFGASFVFTVAPAAPLREINLADTSSSAANMPFYKFDTAEDLLLPKGCALIGIEITDMHGIPVSQAGTVQALAGVIDHHGLVDDLVLPVGIDIRHAKGVPSHARVG